MNEKVFCKKQKKSVKRLTKRKRCTKIGSGLLDTIIDKLPFELHVSKYQCCGPGSHLENPISKR